MNNNNWMSRLLILNVCLLLLVSGIGFQYLYFYTVDKKLYNKEEILESPIMVKDNNNPQSHIAESIRNSEEDSSTYQYYNMERLPQNVINEIKILCNKDILSKEFMMYLLDGEMYVEASEGNYSYEYNISILQYGEVVGRMNITTEKSTGKITFLVIYTEVVKRDKNNRENYKEISISAEYIREQIQKIENSRERERDYIRYLGLDTTLDWTQEGDNLISKELGIRVGEVQGSESYFLFAESTLAKKETNKSGGTTH